MATPQVPFHSLPARATAQHQSSWHTIMANLDGPTTEEFHSHTKHLSANLMQLTCSHPLVSKKFVIDLLGEKRKWCRSMCFKNSKEMLVDMVPKGDLPTRLNFIEILKKESGTKKIGGVRVACTWSLAKGNVDHYEIGDYAAILTWGHALNSILKADFMYPNQDWEPPVNSIPAVVTDKTWTFDPVTSANAVVETLRPGHFRPPPSSTISSPPVVVVDQ